MTIETSGHKSRCTWTIIAATVIVMSLFSATTLLSLEFAASAGAQKTNQSQSNKTKTAGTIAPPIGNVKQLSKALGNNTKIISNNTKIGNPNATKAAQSQQKVTSSTPKNGLPSNPTKGGGSASNSSGGKTNHSGISSGPGKV